MDGKEVFMGLFSTSYHDLCEKGKKAFNSGNLEKAIELFLKAIEKDPHHPRAFGWLGMTYGKASNFFFMQGDDDNEKKFCEWSVKAFDEAIQRETDPQMKAEHWWQRGVALGGLHRLEERDASWREADKIVSGYTTKRREGLMNAVIDSLQRKGKGGSSF
jgi:tetratricopeptide (TPR) repeat protein